MSLHFRQCRSCLLKLSSHRSYSAAATAKARPKRKHSQGAPPKKMPAYPYGPATLFKQRDSGLYGGASVRYGNSRTEKTIKKFDDVTKRVWHPNVHLKRLWSDSLNEFVRIKVQMRVLRTIDKVGGLDNYLMGEKPARIKALGMRGWSLRWRIMQTKGMRERREDEREALGLPREGIVAFDEGKLKRMEMGARGLAEKYVRIMDEEKAVKEAEQEDEERLAAEQELINEAELPVSSRNGEYSQRRVLREDRFTAEEQQESAEEQIESETGITDTAGKIDDLAVQIAADTRRASRSLPLPNLYSSLDDNKSLYPLIRVKESGKPLLPPQIYLERSLASLARNLNTTTSVLIESARSRLAERYIQKEEREAKKQLAADRRAAIASPDEDAEPIPILDPHDEIDTAIASGPSTLLPIYNQYLSLAQTVLETRRKERDTRRHELANRHLRELRTKKHKGGKGVYKNRSAWDTAFKQAGREIGPKPTITSSIPEALSVMQWRRLYRAGRGAIREQNSEIRREWQRERRPQVYSREEPSEALTEQGPEEREGVRGWMSDKEVGMMDRLGGYFKDRIWGPLMGFRGRREVKG